MSARDKFKSSNMMGLNNESGAETITDLIQNNLEADQSTEKIKPIEKPVEKPKSRKRAPGRPRKFSEDERTVVLGIRVPEHFDAFLQEHGGIYGGKTGYVTHLIRKEMIRYWAEEEKLKED